MQVVDHERPRSAQLGQAAHVALGHLAEVELDLGRVRGRQVRLGFPATERRLARDQGDAPGVAACLVLVDVVREQEAPGERSGVDARLVGQALGEGPGEAVRLAGRVRQVLDPRPGESELARLLLEVGHEPGLADAGVADDDDDVSMARRAGASRGSPAGGLDPCARPMSRPCPAPPTSRWSRAPRRRLTRTGVERPRTRRSPTISTSRRFRAARTLASSRSVSPGSASSWRRIAVVTVSPVTARSRASPTDRTWATTSPVAMPTRSRSDASPRTAAARSSVAVISMAHSAGPHGVVVVGVAGAEEREDRVADELLDDAAVPLDRRRHEPERLLDPVARRPPDRAR